MKSLYSLFLLGLSGLLSGCGQEANSAAGSCANQTAAILVFDGVSQIGCGCVEASGTRVDVSGTLTCTVSSNTAVTFHFINLQARHQIDFVSGPSQIDSPIVEPGRAVVPFAATFTQLGTYGYQNPFGNSPSGQIIVQ